MPRAATVFAFALLAALAAAAPLVFRADERTAAGAPRMTHLGGPAADAVWCRQDADAAWHCAAAVPNHVVCEHAVTFDGDEARVAYRMCPRDPKFSFYLATPFFIIACVFLLVAAAGCFLICMPVPLTAAASPPPARAAPRWKHKHAD
jgi:hypothetical protein